MKIRIVKAGILCAALLIPFAVLARQMPSQQAVGSPTTIPPADSLVLSWNAANKQIALTPAEFGALPHVTVKVHNGHSDADESYAGLLLTVLLAKVEAPGGKNLRGKAMTTYIVAAGSDGYAVVLSLAEVDPEFRTEQVIVADSRDGKPLGKSGPFQLIVPGDKRPARWVHNLSALRVEQAN